ncbi:MAG: UbiD family decarboxylase domain-containing protein [Granulosicoccus sp.]
MSETTGGHDLRGFIEALKTDHPREHIEINDELSGDWELAVCTIGLEEKLRVPVIQYTQVTDSSFIVVHNVCSSMQRIARVMGWTVDELESRLAAAYDSLLPPATVTDGPVREWVLRGDDVDLQQLPAIRYTESQIHPYLSAACVVARDSESGALNLSFNRLMISDRNTLAIHMTPGSDLDTIFQNNKRAGRDTPIAAFIGSHPLWSLGSLASGALSLDEYSVIGGLLGQPLAVVPGLLDDSLLIPAAAEFALEGYLSKSDVMDEGPYGEAFGFVSPVGKRPVVHIELMSHRVNPLFQDIVPGHMEHMTMTSAAIRVHLQKTLLAQFDSVLHVFLPAAMTVHVGVASGTCAEEVRAMLESILTQQRFVKHAIAFDHDVKIDNARQTQRALLMHVQLDRDLVMLTDQPGNGLDPSESNGRTTKWGIDATTTPIAEGEVERNALPQSVRDRIDVNDIWKRAQPKASK